jgi:hypothetical protein
MSFVIYMGVRDMQSWFCLKPYDIFAFPDFGAKKCNECNTSLAFWLGAAAEDM